MKQAHMIDSYTSLGSLVVHCITCRWTCAGHELRVREALVQHQQQEPTKHGERDIVLPLDQARPVY